MGNLFNTFLGLPVHPLVDHFAVVLFPLALVMVLALVAVRSWRRRYGWLTMGLLTLGTAAVLAAKESGERLARTLGTPREHARWANALVWVALPGLLVTLAWFVVDRASDLRARRASHDADADVRPDPSALRGILAGTTALAALTGLVLVALVGHSGARATWGHPAPASPTPPPSTTPTPSAPAMPRYSLAQVGSHGSPGSCWAVINGGVYDLTDWISQHPGGGDPVRAICGKDGSSAFNRQHGRDVRPQQFLAQYRIGTLG